MAEQIIFPNDLTELKKWFDGHSNDTEPVWVVIYKISSRKQVISFSDLVEEAICYGWIDIKVKTIDAERYALLLSPRQLDSHWTDANKQIAEQLLSQGRMTPRGQEVYYRAKANK